MSCSLRSSRWRRAVVVACLPYLMASVFVEFLHVHPFEREHVVAGATLDTSSAVRPGQQSVACPACNQQRIIQSPASRVPLGPGAQTPAVSVTAGPVVWPARPVPHPAAFRGPPLTVLA